MDSAWILHEATKANTRYDDGLQLGYGVMARNFLMSRKSQLGPTKGRHEARIRDCDGKTACIIHVKGERILKYLTSLLSFTFLFSIYSSQHTLFTLHL